MLIREKTFTDLEKTVRANSPHDSTKHFGPELNAEGLLKVLLQGVSIRIGRHNQNEKY